MKRLTIKSVTCFVQCGDEFLFVHRTKKSGSVDHGLLNGVGGKVDPGENYLQTALRETAEETGYHLTEADARLAAVVNLEGGYSEDWVMCFFVLQVPTKDIPIGTENDEGQLLWLHKDVVLNSGYELVDDLNYLWQPMMNSQDLLFAQITVNDAEKVESCQINTLNLY